MDRSEIIGLLFFAALGAGLFFGLKALSRDRTRTEEEFERGASESSSLLGAAVRGIQGFIDPEKGRSEQVVRELKRGEFNRVSVAAEGNDDQRSGENTERPQ